MSQSSDFRISGRLIRCPAGICRAVAGGFFLLAAAILLASDVRGEVIVSASAATEVTPVEGGFRYSYTITNTSLVGEGPGLLAWGMPFFDDAASSFVDGEASVFAPDGWTWLFTPLTSTSDDSLWGYVAADDPKNDTYGAPGSAFDDPPYALVFYADFPTEEGQTLQVIEPGGSLGGFGYVSPFDGVNVPFIAAFDNLQLTIGDPVAPRTPSFPAAVQSVPEPAGAMFLLVGAVAAGVYSGVARKRR